MDKITEGDIRNVCEDHMEQLLIFNQLGSGYVTEKVLSELSKATDLMRIMTERENEILG